MKLAILCMYTGAIDCERALAICEHARIYSEGDCCIG